MADALDVPTTTGAAAERSRQKRQWPEAPKYVWATTSVSQAGVRGGWPRWHPRGRVFVVWLGVFVVISVWEGCVWAKPRVLR